DVETLDLRVNRIDNIDEFKYLKNLQKLKTLYLNGNRKIKEHFIIIKNMLTQIENFDNKIMKEQNNLTSNLEEKREEFKLHKDISKKNILITSNNDNNNNNNYYNVTHNYSNIKSPAKNKTKMVIDKIKIYTFYPSNDEIYYLFIFLRSRIYTYIYIYIYIYICEYSFYFFFYFFMILDQT
ncbi:hypothetical protein PFDG_02708, partial [Plasmodium falciparum Dd2]